MSYRAESGISYISESGRVIIQDDRGLRVVCPLLGVDADKVIASWGMSPANGRTNDRGKPVDGDPLGVPEGRTAETTPFERLAYARWPSRVIWGAGLLALGLTALWIGGEVLSTTVILIEGVGLLHTPIVEGATLRWLVGTLLVVAGAIFALGGGSLAVTSWRGRHEELVTAPIRDPVVFDEQDVQGGPLAIGLLGWLAAWIALAVVTDLSAFVVLCFAAGVGVILTAVLALTMRHPRPLISVLTILQVGVIAAGIGAAFDWLR